MQTFINAFFAFLHFWVFHFVGEKKKKKNSNLLVWQTRWKNESKWLHNDSTSFFSSIAHEIWVLKHFEIRHIGVQELKKQTTSFKFLLFFLKESRHFATEEKKKKRVCKFVRFFKNNFVLSDESKTQFKERFVFYWIQINWHWNYRDRYNLKFIDLLEIQTSNQKFKPKKKEMDELENKKLIQAASHGLTHLRLCTFPQMSGWLRSQYPGKFKKYKKKFNRFFHESKKQTYIKINWIIIFNLQSLT